VANRRRPVLTFVTEVGQPRFHLSSTMVFLLTASFGCVGSKETQDGLHDKGQPLVARLELYLLKAQNRSQNLLRNMYLLNIELMVQIGRRTHWRRWVRLQTLHSGINKPHPQNPRTQQFSTIYQD